MAAPTYKEASDAIIRRIKEITSFAGNAFRWSSPFEAFEDSIYSPPFVGIALRAAPPEAPDDALSDDSSFVEVMDYELIFVAQDFNSVGASIEKAEELLDDIRVKFTGYRLNNGAETPVNYDSSPTKWLGWTKDAEYEAMGASVYRGLFSLWAYRS